LAFTVEIVPLSWKNQVNALLQMRKRQRKRPR
jgi:hypothetical protein